MPTGVVVVLGHFVKAHDVVVQGAHPLGGVDDPALQVGEDLAARSQHHGAAGLGQHLAAQAGDAHLQALEVVDGVDLLVEPAAHLHAGVARRAGDQVEGGVGFFPQLQAVAAPEPGGHAHRVEAEGHRREPLGRRSLARPVVGRAAAGLHRAVAHRFEGAEGGYQLTGRVDLDVELATGHLFDPFGQAHRPGLQIRQLGRPGGDHFPFDLFLGQHRRGRYGGGRSGCRGARTGLFQEVASFHSLSSCEFLTDTMPRGGRGLSA